MSTSTIDNYTSPIKSPSLLVRRSPLQDVFNTTSAAIATPQSAAVDASSSSSTKKSPQRSGVKPRLLWRNDLVLQDGTHVPGVAIVSYADPFQNASTPTRTRNTFLTETDLHRNVDANAAAIPIAGTAEHPAREAQQEAEAGLCLALEMMRHRPLRIASILTDAGTDSKPSSRNLARAPSFTQTLSHSNSQQAASIVERQTHWVSSGEIRVYLDPQEHSTIAFFQNLFCFDANLVRDADSQRSSRILTVSLDGPDLDNDTSDVFSNSTRLAAPHSELAIFAQPVDEQDSAAGNLFPDQLPIKLVLGRKVVVTTKRPSLMAGKDLKRVRSFHRQNSMGSQMLQHVFSQAGVSMPQFVASAPISVKGPRPDDPLPRGSINALLKARSKRKSQLPQRRDPDTHTSRSHTPVIQSQQDEAMHPSESIGSRTKGHDPTGHSIKAGGTHTPGRRGEKRRRLSDRKVAGSPTFTSRIDLNGSPRRSRIGRADQILIEAPFDMPQNLKFGEHRTMLHRASDPSPTGVAVKSEVDLDLLQVGRVKLESSSTSPEPTSIKSTSAPTAWGRTTPCSDASDPVPLQEPNVELERSNRAMIKKLVHHILTREHELVKSDADYLACYQQTCSGIWCTFRKTATTSPLDREAVEKVARIHLSLYLEGLLPVM